LVAKRTLETSLLFLIASLLIPSILGQFVISPYDWFQVGAFAKYTNTRPPDGLVFPNGTIIPFMPLQDSRLASSSVLEWIIIDKTGSSVRLNVTFSASCKNITFYKELLLDVNIYTRDTVIDGEPIGKTCFWAEPYAEVGQGITLYGKPSDQINGNVIKVVTENVLDQEVKEYFVDVPVRLDPCLIITPYPRFVWHTGMASAIVLVGSRPVGPKEDITFTFLNETTVSITRFSSTPLGEKLCVYGGFATYSLYLNETSVRLGPGTEAEGTSGISLLKYYPHIFVASVVFSTLAFIVSFRRKRREVRKH